MNNLRTPQVFYLGVNVLPIGREKKLKILPHFFLKKEVFEIEEFHTVCILFITKRTTIVTTNHRIFLRKRISMGKCAPKIFYIKPEKREFFTILEMEGNTAQRDFS